MSEVYSLYVYQEKIGDVIMEKVCAECGVRFYRPDRGKGSRGVKSKYCPPCRKKVRKKKAADRRYQERQQFKFARKFVTQMADAQTSGQLARWLTTVDLQTAARKCSKEGLADFPIT